MAANALDYDDTGATGHPGATVIPAALALAEARGRSGAELLAAVLAGYEVAIRIRAGSSRAGRGASRSTGAAPPRPSAPWRLRADCSRLGPEETLGAFGLAGAFAPLPHEAKFGWDEDRLSWVKDNVAWPAEAGSARPSWPPAGSGRPTRFSTGSAASPA